MIRNKSMNPESTCTMCGRKLDEVDQEQDFYFKRWIGYGSKYDLHIFEVRFCCSCFDEILDKVLPMFKFNPLSEYEILSDGEKLIAKIKED